jgi:hypothetical protein
LNKPRRPPPKQPEAVTVATANKQNSINLRMIQISRQAQKLATGAEGNGAGRRKR